VKEASEKAMRALRDYPGLVGCYITTANSISVLRALKGKKKAGEITVITTDLFPELVPYLRSGAIAASIHQRPRAQGQLALRILQGFLRDGTCPTDRVTLAPHVVTRSNLDYFLTQYAIVERSI
jgi:LacI family transcriptional regulator